MTRRRVTFHSVGAATSLRSRAVIALVFGALVGMWASNARASGLYFADRGVRPMGRAGAFVAGADDLSSIWYNPAGLAEAGSRASIDLGWLRVANTFARVVRVVDADNTVRYVKSDPLDGVNGFLPIPNLAASLALDRAKRLTVAVGMTLPYVALPSYPEYVNGRPSATRNPKFSVDLSRSVAAYPGAWLAYKVAPELFVGAGVQVIAGVAGAKARITANVDDRILGAPELPDHDTYADLDLGPFVAPSANAGLVAIPDPRVRLGASVQAPTTFSSSFAVRARLPPGLSPTGNEIPAKGSVSLVLPPIVRVGVELRPVDGLRLEATYVHEFWSMHDAIKIHADDVNIGAILGTTRNVALSSFSVPRGFVDASSFRLGGEYRVALSPTAALDLRAGASFDTSAVPSDYVSPMSLDADKVVTSMGGGIHLGSHWRLDAVFSMIFVSDVDVDPRTAKLHRIDPFGGGTTSEATNGGAYRTSAQLVGFGVDYVF